MHADCLISQHSIAAVTDGAIVTAAALCAHQLGPSSRYLRVARCQCAALTTASDALAVILNLHDVCGYASRRISADGVNKSLSNTSFQHLQVHSPEIVGMGPHLHLCSFAGDCLAHLSSQNLACN